MRHEEYIAATGPEIERFATLLEGKDLSAPVPGCPDWDLARLIGHTGVVHRWATRILETEAQEPIGFKAIAATVPTESAELPAWLAAGAAPLLAALDGDPDTSLWGWGGDTRGWWARRMLHETTVHRADAEMAIGCEPEVVAEVAVDGVDEFLANLPALTARKESGRDLSGSGETLHLHATDAPGEWTITLTPAGFTWERGHSKATVALRGSAVDLLLFVYGRRRALDGERYQTFGDTELLARWTANTAV
jgi:uncharacterized protein (TIGR03083 family)